MKNNCFLSVPNNNNSIFGFGSPTQCDYSKNPKKVIVGKNEKNGKVTASFGGKFTQAKLGMYITKVIYNDPVTIVFWSDNTKTMCKCQEGDIYNKEMGLTLCVLKKIVGGDQVASLIKDWVYEDENVVDLRLVRYKSKQLKNELATEDNKEVVVKEEPISTPKNPTKKNQK